MESRYTDILGYDNYLLDLELQQADMTRYVNECVILSGSDKRKAIEEMTIFNEGALGDKFKKVWARIKSFFAKIYQKFLESLQAWASDNIAYLKQYGNIIFEKKCTLKTVKMQDHFEGQKNFDTMITHVKDVFAKIPDLSSIDAIMGDLTKLAKSNPGDKLSEKGSNLVDDFTYAQQTSVLQAIGMTNTSSIADSSDLQGFAGRFRNWLNGGEEINEYSGSELEGKNMELMYNFLYRYDATVEKLKKIKDAFDTGMTAIETSFKKGYDAMSKSVKGVDKADVVKAANDAADKSKSDDSIKGTLASELRDATKEAKATKEAYSYVYGRVINEADIDSGKSNNTDTKINTGDPSYNSKNYKTLDTENKTTRKQGTETASDVKSNTNQIKGNVGGKGQLTAAALKGTGVTDENLSKYEDYALSMIRAWGNTRSICMGAALNSLSDTRRDYFDVIRAHVRSWIGTTAGPDQNTDAKPTNTNATH